jgi:ribosomal protein S18 acetylase RimI-like enzyme
MESLVSDAWSREKPHVGVHVGDLEWWTAQQDQDPFVVSLWYTGDELVGWAWCSRKLELDSHVAPDHREGPLQDLMLDWFESTLAAASGQSGEGAAFLFEPSPERMASMATRGYRQTGSYVHHQRRLSEPLPESEIPDGFELRHVRGPDDIDRRVAVHRSAFAPSRMTPQRYRSAMASDHYRTGLDWVSVAPNGTFASFCNIWLDQENGVGLLEPVGTADGYRRMGLGRAVCLAAMAATMRAGADTAIVLSAGDNAASMALYRSLGFQEFGRSLGFVKDPG